MSRWGTIRRDIEAGALKSVERWLMFGQDNAGLVDVGVRRGLITGRTAIHSL